MNGKTGKYRLENDTLKIDLDSGPKVMATVQINGDKMVLTDPTGVDEYRRVK